MDLSHTLMIQTPGMQPSRQVRSLQEPLQPLHWHGSTRFLSRIAATVVRPVCIGARIVANTVASVAAASLQRSLQPLQVMRKCTRHQRKVLQRSIVVIKVLFPGIYKIYPGLQQCGPLLLQAGRWRGIVEIERHPRRKIIGGTQSNHLEEHHEQHIFWTWI